MTLKLSLVIDGDAKGAKAAASETSEAIQGLSQTAATASGKVATIGEKAETAMGQVSSSSTTAVTNVSSVGRAADNASGKFSSLGTNAKSVLTGLAAGVVSGLIVVAFDKLIGKVFEYVEAIVSSEPQIKASLEKHEALVDRVTASFRRAKGAASDYGQDSRDILRLAAQSNIPRLEQSFETATDDVAGRLTPLQPGQFGITVADAERINPVLRQFREEVSQGKADVIAFRDEIAKIAGALPKDHPFKEMAERIIAMTEPAANLQAELSRANDVIRSLDGDANAAARAFGAFAGKIVETNAAAGGAIANLTEVHRLMSSISGQGSFTPIPNATAVPTDAFAAGGIVSSPTAFRFNGGRLGIMGESGPEAILPLSAGPGGLAVGAVANDNRETTLGLKRLASGKLGVQLPSPFAAGGIFPSEHSGQQSGGITAFAQGGVAEGGIFGDLKGLSNGFLSGLIADLRQSKNLTDALLGSLNQLADRVLDKFLQKGIDDLFSSLTGSSGGGGGGLFGGLGSIFSSLFGFADGAAFGGPNRAAGIVDRPTFFAFGSGSLGVMGEAGPEAILPLTSARGGLAVGAVTNDNRETSLPLTRLKSGRLGVNAAQPLAFADGGIFSTLPAALTSGSSTPDGPSTRSSEAADPMNRQAVNHFHISTPNPRAFAEDRVSVIRGANKLTRQSGRFS